jgi:hypothetical protein
VRKKFQYPQDVMQLLQDFSTRIITFSTMKLLRRFLLSLIIVFLVLKGTFMVVNVGRGLFEILGIAVIASLAFTMLTRLKEAR